MQTLHFVVYLVERCLVEQYVVRDSKAFRASRLCGNYFSRRHFVDSWSGTYSCQLRRLAAIDQENVVSVAAPVAGFDQQGHDEQVIINQIRNTGSTFQLTPSDLDFLKTNSVPARVIVEMQSARPAAAGRPVVIREQPTVIYRDPAPVYIVPHHRHYHHRHPGVFFHYCN